VKGDARSKQDCIESLIMLLFFAACAPDLRNLYRPCMCSSSGTLPTLGLKLQLIAIVGLGYVWPCSQHQPTFARRDAGQDCASQLAAWAVLDRCMASGVAQFRESLALEMVMQRFVLDDGSNTVRS
jgi:hypothetical protein